MHGSSRRSVRRALLAGIAASLTATALLAVGILLLGHFGETEGRILATTALLAAYGLLALPGGLLLDQARLPGLAAAVLTLAAGGFAVAVTTVWWPDHPTELGKSLGTVTALAAASAQPAALALRRRERDPVSVRRLYRVSSALVLAAATLVSVAIWAELESALYFRVLGSLAVLDVLAVALQPVLALARPESAVYRLRILVEPDGVLETATSGSRRRAGREWSRLRDTLPTNTVPHHNFHVFGVYPFVGLLRAGSVEEPLRVLESCRIAPARVDSVSGEEATVTVRPLAWDGSRLHLDEPQARRVSWRREGLGFLDELRAGDWVSVHWDWVCDRLAGSQVESLQRYTARMLALANRGAVPAAIRG